MPSRRKFLHDGGRGRSDERLGIEHLLLRGDAIGVSGEKISRCGDVLQRKLAAKADKGALGEAVFLKQKLDRLKVIDARERAEGPRRG